jgi:hypothetical protein
MARYTLRKREPAVRRFRPRSSSVPLLHCSIRDPTGSPLGALGLVEHHVVDPAKLEGDLVHPVHQSEEALIGHSLRRDQLERRDHDGVPTRYRHRVGCPRTLPPAGGLASIEVLSYTAHGGGSYEDSAALGAHLC